MWRRSPGRGRRVEPALAPEKGGDPRQWGGPAEPSVPTRAYGTYPVRLQQTK